MSSTILKNEFNMFYLVDNENNIVTDKHGIILTSSSILNLIEYSTQELYINKVSTEGMSDEFLEELMQEIHVLEGLNSRNMSFEKLAKDTYHMRINNGIREGQKKDKIFTKKQFLDFICSVERGKSIVYALRREF